MESDVVFIDSSGKKNLEIIKNLSKKDLVKIIDEFGKLSAKVNFQTVQ